MNRITTTVGNPATNLLLATLPRDDFARWRPHLELVDLREGEVLHEMGRTPRWAYFPVTAVISMLVPTQDGRIDEVCAVGREGMSGVALLMDGGESTTRAIVQGAGRAFRVRPAWIQQEFANSPPVTHLLLHYTIARSAELAQSVVCGRHHTAAQRLCRRLLQAMDRQEGGDIRMTHEQLAGLLGVRRESITSEALKLERARVIQYSRGHIKVLDRAGLLRRSCECYSLVSGAYQRMANEVAKGQPSHRSNAAELATHLQKMRDQERGDLARELHDELGSLLTRAKLDLAGLKQRMVGSSAEVDQRMQHLGEMLNLSIAFSRRVVEGLHPSSLTNLGLAASISILAREFQKGAGIATQLDMEDVDVDDEIQLVIYRMVQESLNNISKYAAARQVGISILNGDSEVIVAVRDDGRGFDTAAAGPASHGLASMRHRVQACAGEFTISSRPGAGTIVVAVLPARRRFDGCSPTCQPLPSLQRCAVAG
jgi:signal transduction histidine kinase